MNAVWAVLLMLVVVIGLRLANRRLADRRRKALDQLAAQLGFGSKEFGAPGGAIQSGTTAGTPTPGTRATPLDDAATAVWGTRKEIHGQWNGRAVSIGAVPARRHRKAIAARCRLPPEMGLWAHPRRKAIAEPPEKTPVVRGGDPTFDAAIPVAARDPAAAERLLARPAVRRALSELSSAQPAFVHNDCVYLMPYDDVLNDVSAIRRLLDQVATIAAHLDRALETDSSP